MTITDRGKLGSGRIVAVTFGLVVTMLGIVSAPAVAAPSFGIELSRDATVVSRSDERVDYTVHVTNTASSSVGVGAQLRCSGTPEDGARWNGRPSSKLHFAYQWIRNGAPILAATEKTYTTVAADEGKALQCVLRGTVDATNPSESPTYAIASQPPVLVEPLSSTSPPVGGSPPETVVVGGGNESAVGKELECTPPTDWAGSPSWTYVWLSNGSPATGPVSGANGERYEMVAADEHALVQCEVIGSNAGGMAIGISATPIRVPGNVPTGVEGSPNMAEPRQPTVITSNYTNAPTTVEVELPAGEGTFVKKVTDGGFDENSPLGWSCSTLPAIGGQPAKAICSSTEAVNPAGGSFPPFTVIAALGADAPRVAVARATVYGGGAAMAAQAENVFEFGPAIPFGFVSFESKFLDPEGHDYTQAGGHPFSGVGNFSFPKKRALKLLGESSEIEVAKNAKYLSIEHIKQIFTDLPPGVIGNPQAIPEPCPNVSRLLAAPTNALEPCPPSSIVGGVHLTLENFEFPSPIYAIVPEFGTPAQFAFADPFTNIYTLTARLRPNENYAISLEVPSTPVLNLFEAKATICDWGAKATPGTFEGCKEPSEPGANPLPFFANVTRCGTPPPVVRARMNSWENPGTFVSAESVNKPATGCDKVPFKPQAQFDPATLRADSATGIDAELTMPSNGLEGKDAAGNRDPEAVTEATIRDLKVTFPKGMAVNPTAAEGLAACSAAEIKLGTNDPISCPEASKIGSAEIETPILDEPLQGDFYLAKQGAVEGSLLGLYLVIDSPRNGILIKVPAKVTPDPTTGQLVVETNDIPEAPVSAIKLHFRGGPRAALMTPPRCGAYEITTEMTPSSGAQPVVEETPFTVAAGPGGGPCPSGDLRPALEAGTQSAVAGATAPFVVRLHRDDGSDRFTGLNMTLPPGVSAYLKEATYCPDSTLASISEREGTGQAQIDSPSCPPSSRIGSVVSGAGTGDNPFYVNTGKLYLAGPYKGAPLSVVAVVPAVAGPLDLGTVVVRNAAYVDPETAQVRVVSDPIPTILHGLLLDVRDIRVDIDRPHFTLNPTNCEPLAVHAEMKGLGGGTTSLSNPFRVGGCDRLGFKPQLKLSLKGATKRSGHPALKAVVTYPKQGAYANIARAQVGLPHSEFLDQGNLDKVCTQPELKSATCPKGSVYGYAKAWTPLLDKPLEGPVYIGVGYGHKLPDLVADLNGQVRVLLHGKVDTTKHEGIRSTFEVVPDAPVSRFVLEMKGGKKYGLLENSENICAKPQHANARFVAQNGLAAQLRPEIGNSCKKKDKRARSGK